MNVLSPEAACAILASHGADPARWPADDRAALLGLASRNRDVAAALAQARAVDALLDDWLALPVPPIAIDAAAITLLPQAGPIPARRAIGGWRPALLAASLALVVAVGGWFGFSGQFDRGPDVSVATASLPPADAEAGEADLAFAYVFTPTAAEEDLI